jgi:hypothetical protein
VTSYYFKCQRCNKSFRWLAQGAAGPLADCATIPVPCDHCALVSALVSDLAAAGKRQAELLKIDADSIGLLQMRLANALDEIDALRAQVFWAEL